MATRKVRANIPTIPSLPLKFPGQLRSEQFREHLIGLIQKLEPGVKLPSERALARESGLSLLTVNKVLATIATEGYVERRPGSGTYVRERQNIPEAATPSLQVLRFVVMKPEGLLAPGRNGYSTHFYLGLRQAAERDGIEVLPTAFEKDAQELVRLPADAFASSSVKGLIFVDDGTPDYRPLYQYLKEGRSIVAFDFAAPETGLSTVMYGDTDGLRQAVEHCLARGHRRIAYVGPAGSVGQPKDLRLAGYRAAMAAAGIPEAEQLVIESRWNTREVIRPVLQRPSPERPTAFVGFMDYYLLSVIKEAWAQNLKVPEDLSVVGFGEALKHDALTPIVIDSIAFDEVAMGRAAYELWKSGAKGVVKRMPGRLVEHGTVAPPRV